MRSTRIIATIAEAAHMMTVKTNTPAASSGVITIGKALFAVARTTIAPITPAIANPKMALSSA